MAILLSSHKAGKTKLQAKWFKELVSRISQRTQLAPPGNADQRIWYSSYNGTTWSQQQLIPGASSVGPSLAYSPFQKKIYAAWKGSDTDQRIWYSTYDGSTWSQQQLITRREQRRAIVDLFWWTDIRSVERQRRRWKDLAFELRRLPMVDAVTDSGREQRWATVGRIPRRDVRSLERFEWR